jgi:Kdo2-lipid IVA lauroyltransferase/acyltransferase
VNVAYRLEALLVQALLGLLRRLRPESSSNLGAAVARTIGPLLPVSRVAHANLAAALPALSAADRARVVRGVWENLGRTVAELPHVAGLRRDAPSGPGYEIVNAEALTRLAASGGPALLVSAHIGNWEVLPAACAACGVPFSSVFRAAANPLVDQVIQGLRRQAVGQDVPMFNKGATGARGALGHLMRGGCVGMLVDQKMNDGIAARLFGMPAMTAPAAAAFALRFRCPVICGHVERIGPARFRMVVEDPLKLPDSGNRQADIAALTQQINDVLERWIRARPESWLWLHRRWPKDMVDYGPDRK